MVRRVKFLRHMLLALGAVIAISGCQTRRGNVEYTKFRVTNYRGELVANWIAEGSTRRVGDSFKIRAVERTSGAPYPQTTRYPNGWKTTVAGPHIVYWRCGKPLWLYELDGY